MCWGSPGSQYSSLVLKATFYYWLEVRWVDSDLKRSQFSPPIIVTLKFYHFLQLEPYSSSYDTWKHFLHYKTTKKKKKLNSKIIHSTLYLQKLYIYFISVLTKLMLLFLLQLQHIHTNAIVKWCGGGISFCFRKIHYNNYSHSSRNAYTFVQM